MAISVALVNVNCSESPISFSIFGTGMDSNQLVILAPDLTYVPFTVVYNTPDLIKIQLTNPFVNGEYRIGFNPAFVTSGEWTFVTTLQCPAPNLSGIYFINPVKIALHDSYYNSIEKKIPDPMIRTALIGE